MQESIQLLIVVSSFILLRENCFHELVTALRVLFYFSYMEGKGFGIHWNTATGIITRAFVRAESQQRW